MHMFLTGGANGEIAEKQYKDRIQAQRISLGPVTQLAGQLEERSPRFDDGRWSELSSVEDFFLFVRS